MTNFTASFAVEQSARQVFDAINNPRGWWSQAIEGSTDKLGAQFAYHNRDLHRARFTITELVPEKKVVWHVDDNYFNFVKDRDEWIGTDVVFEIEPRGTQTIVRFTHVGLVPAYECYDVCSNAWGGYITKSLRDLIATGTGRPNPIGYTTSFTVDQSAQQVFDAVTNVRGWWSPDIRGRTDELDAEFTFRAKDVHLSTQRITELIPGKKVVWRVLDSRLSFIKHTSEWNDTQIVFEISEDNGKTKLAFTHVGLVPDIECYGDCSGAWNFYINDSLRNLITTGKGQPG